MNTAQRTAFFQQNGYARNSRAAALTQFLSAKGYDALYVKDQASLTRLVGGNQIVVFDPQNVVILK